MPAVGGDLGSGTGWIEGEITSTEFKGGLTGTVTRESLGGNEKRKGTEEGIEKRMEGGSFLIAVLGVRKASERWGVGVEDGVFVVSTLRLPSS